MCRPENNIEIDSIHECRDSMVRSRSRIAVHKSAARFAVIKTQLTQTDSKYLHRYIRSSETEMQIIHSNWNRSVHGRSSGPISLILNRLIFASKPERKAKSAKLIFTEINCFKFVWITKIKSQNVKWSGRLLCARINFIGCSVCDRSERQEMRERDSQCRHKTTHKRSMRVCSEIKEKMQIDWCVL